MLRNGQTYFKNLTVQTPQYFTSSSGQFSTLCMNELNWRNVCKKIRLTNLKAVMPLRRDRFHQKSQQVVLNTGPWTEYTDP